MYSFPRYRFRSQRAFYHGSSLLEPSTASLFRDCCSGGRVNWPGGCRHPCEIRVNDPLETVYGVTDETLAIEKLVQLVLRNQSGKYRVRELATRRDRIAGELQTALARETAPWGVAVRRVEIKSIRIEGV